MSQEDTCIVTREDGSIWCSKCNVSLGNKWNKTVKQHPRSKQHKGKGKKEKKGKRNKEEEEDEEGESEDGGEENSESPHVPEANVECTLCHRMGETRNHTPFLEGGNYCLAPPVEDKPTIRSTPFITVHGGTLPLYPDLLEEALQNYCVGKASRMPNVDINHQCCEVRSLSETRKLLKDAHINKDVYWCAMAIDDHVTDPSWWPQDQKVPGYTQLIIGSGPTDIGIHLDNYGKTRIPVNTYLTICRGVKQVIMLPPGKNDLFVEKQPFPLDIDRDLLQKIQERGGYYFEVKPFSNEEFAALFVPKGWYHWLIGKSDWAVGFGSSRF